MKDAETPIQTSAEVKSLQLRRCGSMNDAETNSGPLPQMILKDQKRRLVSQTETDSPDEEYAEQRSFQPSKCRKKMTMESRFSPALHLEVDQVTSNDADQALDAYVKRDYQSAADLYHGLLSRYRNKMPPKSSATTVNTDMIQACFNLTQCYLELGFPQKAHEALEEVWRADRMLSIKASHSLFGEMSRLYCKVQAQLQSISQKDKAELIGQEDRSKSVQELALFHTFGAHYLSRGRPEEAVALLQRGLGRVNGDCPNMEKSLKDELVGLHLLLAEAFLSLGQLENVKNTLVNIWNPTRILYIDRFHRHFLWMARIHARATRPDAIKDQNTFPVPNFNFYDRLGVSNLASYSDIRKAYKTCSILFHPDKGVECSVMQYITEAHETLADEKKREEYDRKLREKDA